MKRRILGLLLALCLVLSLLPTIVLANTETEEVQNPSEVTVTLRYKSAVAATWPAPLAAGEEGTASSIGKVYYATTTSAGKITDVTAQVEADPTKAWNIKFDNTKTTAELTLKSATLEGSITSGYVGPITVTGAGALKIIVDGNSTVNNTGVCFALAMAGGTTVTSVNNSLLKATSSSSSGYVPFYVTAGSIAFEKANVQLEHKQNNGSNPTGAIQTLKGNITVDNSTITYTGSHIAGLMFYATGDLTIRNNSFVKGTAAYGNPASITAPQRFAPCRVTGKITIDSSTVEFINKSGCWRYMFTNGSTKADPACLNWPNLIGVTAKCSTYSISGAFAEELTKGIAGTRDAIKYLRIEPVKEVCDHDWESITDTVCDLCGETRVGAQPITIRTITDNDNTKHDVSVTAAVGEVYYATPTSGGDILEFVTEEPDNWEVKLDNTGVVAQLVFRNAYIYRTGEHKFSNGDAIPTVSVSGNGALQIVTQGKATISSWYGDLINTKMADGTTYTSEDGALLQLKQNGTSGAVCIREAAGNLTFNEANIYTQSSRVNEVWDNPMIQVTKNVDVIDSVLNLKVQDSDSSARSACGVSGIRVGGTLYLRDYAKVTVKHASDGPDEGYRKDMNDQPRYAVHAAEVIIDKATLILQDNDVYTAAGSHGSYTIPEHTGMFEYLINVEPIVRNINAVYSENTDGSEANPLSELEKTTWTNTNITYKGYEAPYIAFIADCQHEDAKQTDCTVAVNCSICKNELIAAKDHVAGEDDSNCATPVVCTVCGKETIAAKTHDFDTDPTTDDKCKNENCNVTAGIQHVHDYAEVKYDEAGHWTKCNCGAETEKVPHNTDGSVAHKDATCTEEGVVGGTYCTVCENGKAAAEEKIPVVPHNTDGKVEHKDATCTEEGVVGGTYCTVCENGKAAAEEKIPVVPHNTDGKVEHKDATCTEEGVVGGTYCTVCENGKAAAEEKIPVVPHNTDGKVEHKDATCTEEGVVGGTYCTVCNEGKAAAEEKIPVVPHNTDGKVEHKDATCTEEGVVGGTYCTVCGNGKAAAEEKIPVVPHNTDGKVEHKDATCTEEGVVGGTYCTACGFGKEAAEEKIPVVPHNTDGKVDHKDATCTEEGVVGGTYCTVCGNGKAAAEEKIPVVPHNTDGKVEHKDATCTEEGVVGGTYCTVCENGKAAAEEKIPVIGHSYIYTSKNDRTHTVTCANCAVVNSVEDCVDTDANNICDKCKAVLAIYVAENNKGEKFESLQAALNADGKLVTLLTDVVLTEKLVITWSEGGLNLNGFSITGNVVDPFGMIYIKKDATINFIGEGTIENKGGVAIGNYGYVRIEEEVTVIGEESGYAGLYNFYYAPDYYGQASVVGNVNIIWNCGKLNIGEGAEIGYLDNSGYAEVFGEVDEIYAQDGSDCPGVPNAGILSIRDITNVTVPDDYKLVRAGEIGYKVVAKTYVAQVGDEKFETLAEAIAEGGNVTLLADIKLDAAIKVSNTVVLNLNGKNISMTDKDTAGDGVFYVVAGGNLTINGEGVVNGVGNNKYNMVIWADGGKVTINGGIYTNIGAQPEGDNHFDLIYVKNGGEVIINGGEFKCETPFYTLNVNNDLPGTITVNGGKFWNFDPANGDDKLEGSFIAADKHTAVDNNGYFAICGGKIVNHDAKAPTCTEIGWDAYDTCENCDYTTYVAKDATGHNANGKVDHKDATCTEDGVVGGTYCTACNDGKAEAEAVITAPGHNTDGVVDHKDATCTEDGVVGGNYCTVCENGKAAAEEVIAAKGHRFSKVDVTSATCTEAGYITLGCGNCGGEWDSRYDDVAKQYLLDNPYFNLAAKGHNTDGVVDHKDATCTEDGVVGGNYCTVCENGKAAAEEVIAAKGHRFSKVDVTSATCTEAGYITLGCGNCGGEWDSRYDDVAKQYLLDNPYFNLAAKGHNTDGVVDHKDATCTEEGVVGGTYCTACDFGKEAAEEKISATGHKFTEFVKTVKPTDTARGYTVYKCANCDETEVRDIVAAYTDAVAIFEEEYYNTLAEALAAAKKSTSEEKVITMIRKQTGAALVIDTNVTIDFKGLAYTVNTANEDGSAVIIAKDAIVTLENGTIQVRTAQKTLFNKLIVNNGNLTTKDITLRGDNLGAAGERTTIVNKGTLKLDVGTVVTTNMFALEATGNVTKDVTVELEAPEGYDWIDGTTLKGHEHSYTETVVEANFDRSGYTKHVCDCGESYIDSVVANLVAYAVNETTGVRYETFAKAVAEAKDGETVKLLKKQTGAALVINANITINLDGKTYTVNATETGAAIDVADGVTGAKIINGEAETKGMVQIRKTSRANFNCLVNNLGALEANDITLNATYADAEGAVAFKGNAITGNATIVK